MPSLTVVVPPTNCFPVSFRVPPRFLFRPVEAACMEPVTSSVVEPATWKAPSAPRMMRLGASVCVTPPPPSTSTPPLVIVSVPFVVPVRLTDEASSKLRALTVRLWVSAVVVRKPVPSLSVWVVPAVLISV